MGGKTSTASKNKWNKENYDRVALIIPKGQKGVWQAAAEAEGVSLNQFIKEAVETKIKERRGV